MGTATKKTKTELLEEIEAKNQEIKGLKDRVKKMERFEVYLDGANELAAVRDAYVEAGFTKDEAFQLAKETLMIVSRGLRF